MDTNRYIGVTGFKHREEIITCKVHSIGQEPIIMYGILTSAKSLTHPSKEGTRRPSLENFNSLLWEIPQGSLATIHHCTANRKFLTELDTILSKDSIYDRGLVKAVQINQRLPEINEMEKTKKKYSGLKMILQLEPEDLATPYETGKKIKDYDGLVNYIIIDPSRGIGKTLDMYATLVMLQEIKIPMIPVIAGGLHAGNVGEVISFFRKEYGENFSIDAEGRLRDADDSLSIEKMSAYVTAAYEAYHR